MKTSGYFANTESFCHFINHLHTMSNPIYSKFNDNIFKSLCYINNELSNKNIEMLKTYKPENYFSKVVMIKRGINTIN
ncbi:MAG: hypothetical protein ACFFBD_17510, partial [Candidatus Hodarchaeota archaeon]